MGNKKSLYKANQAKNDEYYTLYEDIADEIPKYAKQLKGKRIICPCDWDESYDEEIVFLSEKNVKSQILFAKDGTIKNVDINATKQKIEKDLNLIKCQFVRFLVAHADVYEIESISVSGYNPVTNEGVRFQDIDYSKYDLVITNPPFSLFRDFIDVMFKNNVQFLVIGPITALTYKDIFSHIKKNELWLGYASQLSGLKLPDGTILYSKNSEGSVPRACKWYTNLDVKYRHDKMILTEKFDPLKYPKYYNYDAVDVNKTNKIPYDYEGEMGVPVSFITKFNPDQFEIIGKGVDLSKTKRFTGDKAALWIEKDGKPYKEPFERFVIKNREPIKDDD